MDDLPALIAEIRITGAAAVATADRIRQTVYALAPDLPPPTASLAPAPADLDAIQARLVQMLEQG